MYISQRKLISSWQRYEFSNVFRVFEGYVSNGAREITHIAEDDSKLSRNVRVLHI